MANPAPLQLQGRPASRGVAFGRALHLQAASAAPTAAPAGSPEEEQARLTAALFQTSVALRTLRNQTRDRLGEAKAEIFDVHLSFLNDPELIGRARALLQAPGTSAAQAVTEASQRFIELLEQSGDDTLASRAADLRDVTRRLHAHLVGGPAAAASQLDADVIVIARDLTPSDTAQLNLVHVRGFVTAEGSANSHSAILARALRLPAIVGLPGALETIPDGAMLCLDGASGAVTVHPTAGQTDAARQAQAAQRAEEAALARFARQPSRTADGRTLQLAANIGRLDEVPAALVQGAEGIGLFRSEFSYLDRPDLPDEDELYELYRAVLSQMAPHPVIIRTLDVGGDKQIPRLDLPREENPFLGVRGLRLCLERATLFRTQLRALLRASSHGRLKIMLPMVTLSAEVRQARRWLDEERARLAAAGVAMAATVPLGIMIEVPAAALQADQFAREADFFSIGTNDLTQYTMAADRMNGRLAHLQAAHHPAVLQLIRLTVEAAHRHGKWAGVCGEMGSDPVALPLLDGLGLDEISLQASAITRTRAALSRLDHEANVRLAAHCLSLDSAEAVAAAVAAATS